MMIVYKVVFDLACDVQEAHDLYIVRNEFELVIVINFHHHPNNNPSVLAQTRV